jgi:hypothetical protein
MMWINDITYQTTHWAYNFETLESWWVGMGEPNFGQPRHNKMYVDEKGQLYYYDGLDTPHLMADSMQELYRYYINNMTERALLK